jgi:hypothetical protein
MIANTPTPPYYAVIFTSTRTDVVEGYGDTAQRMVEHRIAQQTGRSTWYDAYKTRICRVERDYGFARD